MIITFCGHAQFQGNNEYRKRILHFFDCKIGDRSADLYLGGYGGFDRFAYECCRQYKETHPQVSLVFVTPYMSTSYQNNHLDNRQQKYDVILYPGLENKPPKYAISYRNRYMVEQADCVVAYIDHEWGGAYTTYQYAIKKGKEILNLANFPQ